MKKFVDKLYKKVVNYLKTNILFVCYFSFSLLMDLIIRCMTGGSLFAFKPFIANVAILTIFGSFGYLMKHKSRFIYYFSLMFFNCALCIVNVIYYGFYESFASVNLLSAVSMVKSVNDSLFQKMHLYQYLFLLFPISFAIIYSRLNHNKEIIKSIFEKSKKVFKNTIITGFAFLILLVCFLTKTDYSRLFKQWNREYIVQSLGIYIYGVNDIIQSVQPKLNSMFGFDNSYKIFRDFYDKREVKYTNNNYTDVFKGKNVIFIHAESIQNFVVNLKINGNEVTPNLNKLAKSGLYFSSFYPQISVGTSSDTEFTLSTGLMPSSSGTVFVSYADRKYESIQNSFKSLGYYTFSTHGNDAYYWNRKIMYNTLGYDYFYAKDYFDVNEENYMGLGINDKSFFEQIMPVFIEKNASDVPFMSTVITLSNHSTFGEVDKYGPFDVSMSFYNEETSSNETAPYLEGTYIGNYLKSVHYADEALGEFLDSLDENGILDDTVIVLYGDHEARLSKSQLNLLFNYDPQNNGIIDEDDESYISMDNYKYDLLKNTPFIIYSKSDNLKGEIKDVMGMYDVYPTIGNMFGFKSKYALGNDIFSNSEKIVIFPNGNFITNNVYYSNIKDEYILLNENPISSEYIQKYKQYTTKRLDVSNAIIYHDLIKYYEEREKEKK